MEKLVYIIAGLLCSWGLIAQLHWMQNPELTQMQIFLWLPGL